MSGLWVEISTKRRNYYIAEDVDEETASKAVNYLLGANGDFIPVNNPSSHFVNKREVEEIRIVHKNGETYKLKRDK